MNENLSPGDLLTVKGIKNSNLIIYEDNTDHPYKHVRYNLRDDEIFAFYVRSDRSDWFDARDTDSPLLIHRMIYNENYIFVFDHMCKFDKL